eukprot:TRINITY_DN5765_c0_g1_i1.p2 TRINITY_DN5765_c0_g1~~TRINITY_DN5765_c0_g1_i1.p2  ORF type:complete len:204 (+),score=-6.16 TRINITY_DN5765_c0_g1_i1:153-764(+)
MIQSFVLINNDSLSYNISNNDHNNMSSNSFPTVPHIVFPFPSYGSIFPQVGTSIYQKVFLRVKCSPRKSIFWEIQIFFLFFVTPTSAQMYSHNLKIRQIFCLFFTPTWALQVQLFRVKTLRLALKRKNTVVLLVILLLAIKNIETILLKLFLLQTHSNQKTTKTVITIKHFNLEVFQFGPPPKVQIKMVQIKVQSKLKSTQDF